MASIKARNEIPPVGPPCRAGGGISGGLLLIFGISAGFSASAAVASGTVGSRLAATADSGDRLAVVLAEASGFLMPARFPFFRVFLFDFLYLRVVSSGLGLLFEGSADRFERHAVIEPTFFLFSHKNGCDLN